LDNFAEDIYGCGYNEFGILARGEKKKVAIEEFVLFGTNIKN